MKKGKIFKIIFALIGLSFALVPLIFQIDVREDAGIDYLIILILPILVPVLFLLKPKNGYLKFLFFALAVAFTIVFIHFGTGVTEDFEPYYDPELNVIVAYEYVTLYAILCYIGLGILAIMTLSLMLPSGKKVKKVASEESVSSSLSVKEKIDLFNKNSRTLKEQYSLALENEINEYKEQNPIVITIDEEAAALVIEEANKRVNQATVEEGDEEIEYLDVKEELGVINTVKSSLITSFKYLFSNVRTFVTYLFYLLISLVSSLFAILAPFFTVSNYVVTQRIMKGEEISIETSFKGIGLKRFVRFFMMQMYTSLYVLAIIVMFALPVAFVGLLGYGIAEELGLVFVIIGGLGLTVLLVVLVLNLFPLSYVYFKEDINPSLYFARSAELSKGKKKKYVLTSLLFGAVMLVASLVIFVFAYLAMLLEAAWLLVIPVALLIIFLPMFILALNISYVKVMEG